MSRTGGHQALNRPACAGRAATAREGESQNLNDAEAHKQDRLAGEGPPAVLGTEAATLSLSAEDSIRPMPSRSQLMPEPAIATLPSRAWITGA